MPCFHPVPAWRSKRVNRETGKRGISFKMVDGFKDFPVEVPCGKCVGCIQARANEWAMRCEHEAKCWDWNWFITLTYEVMPPDGSLQPKDLQDFWKRLRKRGYEGLRYFACGEYGEAFSRPHYHALVFNWLPVDLRRSERVSDKKVVYESADLQEAWGLGRVQLDAFSPAAAQYVTNYVRKKVLGNDASSHYGSRVREFQTMSRRPGLGKIFLARYLHDIYPDGYVTRPGGSIKRAPRFYDLTLEKVDPRMMRKVRRKRKEMASLDVDNKGSRLYVREEVMERRNEFFDSAKGRPLDSGL